MNLLNLLSKWLLLFVLISSCELQKHATIHMIGDSTMSNKAHPESNPERGWGQMLYGFFDDRVTVINHAVNGRSTKSFIMEARWDSVLQQLQPGDYVFIQFGHNDQKIHDPRRYTNPVTGYRRNLMRFVTESRKKGGIPVLFSSIVRRKFNDSGVLEDTHGIYPLIVREVAQEMGVPFVDLQLKSEDLVLSLGPDKSRELYMWIEPGKYKMYPEGKQDDTHFTEKGATAMAGLAVEGLIENDLDIVRFLKTVR